MNKKYLMAIIITLFVFAAVSAPVAQAQLPETPQRTEIYIAPVTELMSYSLRLPALGGGIAVGGGDRVSIGGRFFFATDATELFTMELTVFVRFFVFDNEDISGLFIQLNCGAAVFEYKEAIQLPTEIGSMSFGVSVGWRFLITDSWFVEPAARIGYPFGFAAGVSAGYRF
ncbi:MAG: hypothetical protein FWD28_02425 [Treponema sp.]|nr:hypothetical protein [Treponema sp.]